MRLVRRGKSFQRNFIGLVAIIVGYFQVTIMIFALLLSETLYVVKKVWYEPVEVECHIVSYHLSG